MPASIVGLASPKNMARPKTKEVGAPEVHKPDAAEPPIEQPQELTEYEQRQITRWNGNGMAYCHTCVRLLQTKQDDTPVCPIGKVGCDRNQ
jgi:hypothetical protein